MKRESLADPEKPFHVTVLGSPKMRWNAQPFEPPRRQMRLLIYIMAETLRPISRDRLMLLLWPNTAESTARRHLTRRLSQLRAALPQPDLLLVDKTSAALNAQFVWSDAVTFTALCSQEDRESWASAVTLYRGSFLDGMSLPPSQGLDAWWSQAQREFEREYLVTMEKLVVTETAAGNYREAIDYARRILATDDLTEAVHRQLITLYGLEGNRTAALRQYESCLAVLERELGVSPLPETRAAYEEVREGRHVAPPKQLAPSFAILPGLDLPLAGRDEALREMATAYQRLRRGGVIFISGEPGVGKSRLMADFSAAQQATVLSGQCQQSGSDLPYQPLIQALRGSLSLRESWRRVARVWLAEVSRLLPEVPDLFPDLPPAISLEPDQAQARLFEAITRVFVSLGERHSPLLLCLDDIHAADAGTRDWLQYFSRQMVHSNVFILAAFRSQTAGFLQEWRAALERAAPNRAGLLAEIELAGLSQAAVAELLTEAAGEVCPDPTLPERICSATQGNAFFVLETIRELVEIDSLAAYRPDLPLAPSIREAVMRRAARLDPLAQQVLETAAVLDPSATSETLAETAGRDELEVAIALEVLVSAQLLYADAERFSYQHELAREAVYQEISSWRRPLLHRRSAGALASLPAGHALARPADIARHYLEAGDDFEAIGYFEQAAGQASEVYAHREAVGYLREAVALAEKAALPAGNVTRLKTTLGDSLAAAGDYRAAETAYLEMLDLSDAQQDNLDRVVLLEKLATTLMPQGRSKEAEKRCREALVLLDSMPTRRAADASDQFRERLEVDVHLALMDSLYLQGDSIGMAFTLKEAQPLVNRAGTIGQKARLSTRLRQKSAIESRFQITDEILAEAAEIVRMVEDSGDPGMIARVEFGLGFCYLWHGERQEAARTLDKALALADDVGATFLRTQCLVYQTTAQRFLGQTIEVADRLPELQKAAQIVASPIYLAAARAQAAWLAWCDGQIEAAEEQARAAMNIWSEEVLYPFKWLALWVLLAVIQEQDLQGEGVAIAKAMLNPGQQVLPEDITMTLEKALALWTAGERAATAVKLDEALNLAREHGYL